MVLTLWILAILAVFAVGLARRAALNLRIAVYQENRLKAGYLARAGVSKAVYLLEKDAHSTKNCGYDTPVACGVDPAGRLPQEIFGELWDRGEGGEFRIGHAGENKEFVYGFQDEDSRININGISGLSNTALLVELFKAANITGPDRLGQYVGDFIDADAGSGDPSFKNGALVRKIELIAPLEDYYAAEGKDVKESRKSARDVYNGLDELITVHADKVNINTASDDVLKILISTAAGANDKEEYLVSRIRERLLQGPFLKNDLTAGPGSENGFDAQDNDANALFAKIRPYLSAGSDFFRFTAVGSYRGAVKEITAVYDRNKSKFVSWHEK